MKQHREHPRQLGVFQYMHALSIFLLTFAMSCAPLKQRPLTNPTLTMTILDFNEPNTSDWYIQNDGVMGGKSSGFMDFKDRMLKFTGEVVTRGGGFTSVISTKGFDFSDYVGVEVRVRGGGRTFEFAIDDGARSRGREVWRQIPFTPTSEWTWIRLPFDQLKANVYGEPYDAPTLKKENIEQLGFYIIDGKDGAFLLEVDEVRGYQ